MILLPQVKSFILKNSGIRYMNLTKISITSLKAINSGSLQKENKRMQWN